VGVLHLGSSSLDLAVLGASHGRRSGEDPTSNPTNPGTTSPGGGQGPTATALDRATGTTLNRALTGLPSLLP
jgi:hypothetical protein